MNEYYVEGNVRYTIKADGFEITRSGALVFFSFGRNREREPFQAFNKEEWETVRQRT